MMIRRVLDLYCGAGGAAMGYYRAFGPDCQITGVDIKPQPHYPFTFVLGDALEYCAAHGQEFDFIHASPPCQRYSKATAWRGFRGKHPDLIGITRDMLSRIDQPWIIENVEDARANLGLSIMLCGTALGLSFHRHRYFQLSGYPMMLVPPCRHHPTDLSFDHGKKQTERAYADAIGCDWMTVQEARQAIPPAYTEWIGHRILAVDSSS